MSLDIMHTYGLDLLDLLCLIEISTWSSQRPLIRQLRKRAFIPLAAMANALQDITIGPLDNVFRQ